MRTTLMVYTLLCFVMWLFTGKVLRFLIPLVPLLCMLSAEGIIQAIGVSMPLPFKDKVRIFFKQAVRFYCPTCFLVCKLGEGEFNEKT